VSNRGFLMNISYVNTGLHQGDVSVNFTAIYNKHNLEEWG
jgi:hypothetical protein